MRIFARTGRWLGSLSILLILAAVPAARGAEILDASSNIRQTKHNLSKNAPAGNTVRSNVDQVCVFCHTPHAATKDGAGAAAGPLWNRKLSTQTYVPYSSTSMDATGLDQPGGSSKLCLSCHDGTLAIGQISVLNGKANPDPSKPHPDVTMEGTETDGTMPVGGGAGSGYTRKLGTNLTNDHPISFTYNDALALKDGELRQPSQSGTPKMIDSRAIGYRPKLPLENGQLQCTTCHDPHLYDPSDTNRKFLRLNRLQKNAEPSGTTFDVSNDIICLACHTKEGYAESAHANKSSANEIYTDTAADQRGFPRTTEVWQASCLNCHDTHTIQGARRLLRNGADGSGNPATENVCLTCHSSTGGTVLSSTTEVPNVGTDFASPNRRMPIVTGTTEAHNPGDGTAGSGKDGIETQTRLADRHVECTDCHNPHRVRKSKNGIGAVVSTDSGTHDHASTTKHTNLISGVLRGSWGVEPRYASAVTVPFDPRSSPTGGLPTGFDLKKGGPRESIATDVDQPYVTREYQICLKCHSNYAYGTDPPALGATTSTTPSYATGKADTDGKPRIQTYTNQAMEFAALTGDQGVKAAGTNHRSWHPVMRPTGRPAGTGAGTRYANASNWNAPFNNDVGSQTMYCSDCHGRNTPAGTSTPANNSANENGDPWGPHGSANDFILKGPWTSDTGSSTADALCFKCHNRTVYATSGATGTPSVFYNTNADQNRGNLHAYHVSKVANWRCSYCHVAVPHGWKNKALLVNLNSIGQEFGEANYSFTQPYSGSGAQQANNRFWRAPYYMGSVLKVQNWAKSGNWVAGDCGDGTGKTWMQKTCKDIP